MSLKDRQYRLLWLVLSVLIVTAVFGRNDLSAQEQSPDMSATTKLKALSDSGDISDIAEIRKLKRDRSKLYRPKRI